MASLSFYAWGEPVLVLLMVAVTWVNYVFGRLVGGDSPYRFRYLAVAVALNVSVLVAFKYLGFIVETLNRLAPVLGFEPWTVPHPPLPMGISFFIFQAITYVVDVYRRGGVVRAVQTRLRIDAPTPESGGAGPNIGRDGCAPSGRLDHAGRFYWVLSSYR